MPEIARFSSEDAARRAMEVALSDILLFRTWDWFEIMGESGEQTKTLSMEIEDPLSQGEADLACERLAKAGFSKPDVVDVHVEGRDDMAIAIEADFILENK